MFIVRPNACLHKIYQIWFEAHQLDITVCNCVLQFFLKDLSNFNFIRIPAPSPAALDPRDEHALPGSIFIKVDIDVHRGKIDFTK